MKKVDLFATMTTFVQVVRKSSFTTAARSLSISRALVSRHITDLETHLGARLLVRTTRSVSLTESGQAYYEFCSRLLREVSNAEQEISSGMKEAEGALSVIVPKWIGSMDVADAVTSFSVEYPKITVDLVLGGISNKTYDFLERGFDVALRTREIPDSQVMVKRIATIRYVVVASPEFLDKHGHPASFRDLHTLPCVSQSDEPVWSFDGDGDATQRIKINPAFTSNAYLVLRKAALKSIGIGLLPYHLVENDLKIGALIPILAESHAQDRPLYAAFAPGGPPSAKVKLFTTFLANWFRKHPLALR